MAATPFSFLSDDIVLNIFFKLEADPRDWARLCCVYSRFLTLIRSVPFKSKCLGLIPNLVADLISTTSGEPPGGWSALYKLAVCCPGLVHAGVLLENSDFGLDRDIGPDETYRLCNSTSSSEPSSVSNDSTVECWSIFDDLYNDTMYDSSESQLPAVVNNQELVRPGKEVIEKRRKWVGPLNSHLASGAWSFSREQGNKLLASRFRGDYLYICDWPGCVHVEEKRKYMLFRGIFKNFKRSKVWRAITDAKPKKVGLGCGFCGCGETYDLLNAFCLKRIYGYHDDGEPVVRAYVCENGHVSGAWTDRPMYT